jgi:RNA polymerase sigma-70 factor (ECF subfamily)
MEDRQIVDLYWQRSEEAIPATAAKYGAYCRTIANNILANDEDAEECVNDTWFSAWNSMPDNRPTLLGSYLGKLTRWLSLTRLRERGRLKRGGGEPSLALEELAEVIADGTDVEHEVELRELNAALRRFLKQLNETERDVFLSRYWFLLPVKDIAARLGFRTGKVSTMLHRTRRKLQSYLKEEGLC